MVVILAAAELFGAKVNKELDFPLMPTLAELKTRAVGVFNDELATARRPGRPTEKFLLHYMQLFDATTGRWVELKSSSQLKDFCQIYLFQKDSWSKESQGPIPSPTKPAVAPPAYVPAATTLAHASPYRGELSGSPLYDTAKLGVVAGSPGYHIDISPGRVYRAGLPAGTPTPGVATAAAAGLAVVPQATAVVQPTSAALAAVAFTPPKEVGAAGAAAGVPAVITADARSPSVLVTFSDKVNLLYSTMIADKPSVDEDAFRTLFRKTRLEFEPVTIAQLFQDTDSNKDAVIAFSEWERFAECYPTMIDAMYVRVRDSSIDDEQKKAIDDVSKVIQDIEDGVYKEKCSLNEASRDVAEAEEKVTRQGGAVEDAKGKERDAKAVLDASRQETERARQTVAQRAADVAHAQEGQARQHKAHLESQRQVEERRYVLQNLVSETAAADRRLQELRKMVEEQEEVLKLTKEREEKGAQTLENTLRAEEAANQSLEESKNETQLALDRLCISEQALTTAQSREEECGVTHLQTREEVNKQFLKQEECEQEVRVHKDKEGTAQKRFEEAEGELKNKQEELKVIVDANAAHNMKRDEDEEREKPLLETEIKLRRQRLALEEEEAKLRNEHRSFVSTTGRV